MGENKIGIVVDRVRLEIRKEPDPNAEILQEILAGSEVMVYAEGTTKHFYKVCTAYGVVGYCMRDFIKM